MSATMDGINGLGWEEFTGLLGGVVETCSMLLAALWEKGPFKDVIHLHDELCKVMDSLPRTVQKGILRNHPDLAGRLADQGLLTAESTREQASAGIDTMTTPEKHQLNQLNTRYREKFGFPFIICVRENKRVTIFKELERRLENGLDPEVAVAIEEVKKISYLRLLDIVEHENVTQ